MLLAELVDELLLSVAVHLSEAELNALAQTSRRFYATLNRDLYRRNARDSHCSALFWAACHGYTKVVQLCLDTGAPPSSRMKRSKMYSFRGPTPLHCAVRWEHEDVVRVLCASGADMDIRDESGQSPLLLAVMFRQMPIVRILVEAGADVHTRDIYSCTPLLKAAKDDSDEISRFLIDSGAEVDARDRYGRTALSLAAEGARDSVVRLLLSRGADVHSRDDTCFWTPLSWAATAGGSDRARAVQRLLIEHGADVNVRDRLGRTPLCRALPRSVRAAEFLIQNGAVVDACNESGRTPLSLLAEDDDADADMVRLLLDSGADINSRDDAGFTPLFWAVRSGTMAMAKLLLDNGARVDIESNRGLSPIDIASMKEEYGVVRLLENFLAAEARQG